MEQVKVTGTSIPAFFAKYDIYEQGWISPAPLHCSSKTNQIMLF